LTNQDTERLLLGVALRWPETILELRLHLQPQDFALSQHRAIWHAILSLAAQGKPVETMTLYDALQSSGRLEQAGGAAYVASLGDGIYKPQDLSHYVVALKNTSRRRQFAHLLEQWQRQAEESADTDKLLAGAYEQLLGLRFEHRNGRPPFVTAREAAEQAVCEILDQARNPGKLPWCLSGIKKLDRATGGFRPKEQVVISP